MKKIVTYIRESFLLRNLLMAICVIIVVSYVVSLMLNLFTRHGQKHAVPNLIGMTVNEAQDMVSKADLEFVVIDSLFVPKSKPGSIVDQSPKAEMGVKSGRKIFITINSLRPKTEEIPYVAGFSLRQAKNKLESKGFEIEQLIYQPDMATNNVLSQSWNGKRIGANDHIKAELGSAITLIVGRDSIAPMPMVPKLIGRTLREAKSRLWENGFNVGEIKYEIGIKPDDYDTALIYKQMPSQEARNQFGSNVDLWFTASIDKVSQASKQSDIDARRRVEVIDEDELIENLTIDQ